MLRLFVVLLLIIISQPVWSAIWIVTYPQSELKNDSRSDYPLALLELALEKTGVRYELKPSVEPMRQARAFKRLEDNLEINVLWSMTDNQREEQLRPIRIPLTRGLIGWRVFLAHKNSTFLKAKINSLNDLMAFSPVQGRDWPDTKILQANGFNVVAARDYMDSTHQLNNRVADFFPRSVIEVLPELKNQYSKNFRLRKGLLIYYPTAYYFFTNKRNLTLSRLIETGLNNAIKDGSYEELFLRFFGDELQSLDIEHATYFKLANPLLPALTPLNNKDYWYFPDS